MEKRYGAIYGMTMTDFGILAVDHMGVILTSTDGAEWKTLDSNTVGYTSITRTGTGGYFAAGGYEYSVSSDGIHWRRATHNGLSYVEQVTRMGKLTVGCFSGSLFTSENDTDWTWQRSDSLGNYGNNVFQAAYNGTVLVAVGNANRDSTLVATSTDAVHWKLRYPKNLDWLNKVVWAKDRFFGMYPGTLASSPDGIIWTRCTVAKMDWQPDIYDVTWTGRRFVAVGDHGQVLASQDGAAWSQMPVMDSTHRYHSIVWTGKRLVLGGERRNSKFIATAEEDPIGILPVTPVGGGLAYGFQGGWLTARMDGDDRLQRACLRNMRGLVVREGFARDGAGGLRTPLAGLGRGAYVLDAEGTRAHVAAPLVIPR